MSAHSSRKFPAVCAKQKCVSDDKVETRRRGKEHKARAVCRCIDVEQLCTNTNVQEALCMGDLVAYKLDGVAVDLITDEWLFEHVVPNLRSRFPGDPRLW